MSLPYTVRWIRACEEREQIVKKLLYSIRRVKNTGRFIMYSGITKNYYRKTVGQVFTKPVQIEGTTQKKFSQ